MPFIVLFIVAAFLILGPNIILQWESRYHGELFCRKCGCEIEGVWKYSTIVYDSKTGIGVQHARQYMECSKNYQHFQRLGKGQKTITVPSACEDKNDSSSAQ